MSPIAITMGPLTLKINPPIFMKKTLTALLEKTLYLKKLIGETPRMKKAIEKINS
jgi:hypothetical protein